MTPLIQTSNCIQYISCFANAIQFLDSVLIAGDTFGNILSYAVREPMRKARSGSLPLILNYFQRLARESAGEKKVNCSSMILTPELDLHNDFTVYVLFEISDVVPRGWSAPYIDKSIVDAPRGTSWDIQPRFHLLYNTNLKYHCSRQFLEKISVLPKMWLHSSEQSF